MNYFFEDFTECNYKDLIIATKNNYKFITYQDINDTNGKVVLWRHDVDFSMHRALCLATIEAYASVTTTYFFYLHSFMYNLLEDEIFQIGKEIIGLGHKIGLHFDPAFYNLDVNETLRFYKCLSFEKKILEDLFETDVSVFSFHNPDAGNWISFDDYKACEMVNTYSKKINESYYYCSDSNGYWRYNRLLDVINSKEDKLHILTHPVWWVPEKMSPRSRVQRCIDGRKEKSGSIYDKTLVELNRVNVE